MNFHEAIRAIDEGRTVMMIVNPENFYRLAADGETIVSRPILCPEQEWRNAVFSTSHIRGKWTVIE